MRRSYLRRLAAVGLLAGAVGAPSLHAQATLEGEVVEVRDETVRADLTGVGTGVPSPGDSVAVLDPTVPGLDPVPVQGSWIVARAEGGSVWIESTGPGASLQPGYLVRIFVSGARPTTQPRSETDVTLEGVLGRYFDAIGGREAWSDVRSIRVRGTVKDDDDTPISFEQVVARPYRLWARVWSEEYTRTRGYDGEGAWIVGERADGSPPSIRIVDHEAQLALARFEADVDGPLLVGDPSAVEFELLDTREMDGVQVFVIGVSPDSGFYHRVFLDADRFVILKLVVPNPDDLDNESDAWVQTFSDYRDVGGLLYPHVRQVVSGGSVTYVLERVEFDVPLDDALFAPP